MDESADIVALIKDSETIFALTSKGWLMKAPLTADGGNLANIEAH